MAGIEKYYEITEVYGWQWDGNTNIKIEDIPEEIRNEVTMLKIECSIKTSFTEETKQLFSITKAINTIYSPVTS